MSIFLFQKCNKTLYLIINVNKKKQIFILVYDTAVKCIEVLSQ